MTTPARTVKLTITVERCGDCPLDHGYQGHIDENGHFCAHPGAEGEGHLGDYRGEPAVPPEWCPLWECPVDVRRKK